MKKDCFVFTLVLFLSLLLFVSAGCIPFTSSAKSDEGVQTFSVSHLKKRVLVFPFVDEAGLGNKIISTVTLHLVASLNESDDFVACMYRSPLKCEIETSDSLDSFGIICNSDILEQARKANMNTVLTGIVYMQDSGTRKKGIWPFDSTVRSYTVSVVVNVVDVVSGTLMLSKRDCHDLLFSLDNGKPKKDEIAKRAVNEGILYMLDKMSPEIVQVIEKQLWTGKIVSVDKDNITIGAGIEAGIFKGMIFNVFAKGEEIKTASGRSYNLIGKDTGKLRVTEVHKTFSLAKPIKGDSFAPGQIIRPFVSAD